MKNIDEGAKLMGGTNVRMISKTLYRHIRGIKQYTRGKKTPQQRMEMLHWVDGAMFKKEPPHINLNDLPGHRGLQDPWEAVGGEMIVVAVTWSVI